MYNESTRGKEEGEEGEKIFRELIAGNFPNLMKKNYVSKMLHKKDKHKQTTFRNIVVKYMKVKYKENIMETVTSDSSHTRKL